MEISYEPSFISASKPKRTESTPQLSSPSQNLTQTSNDFKNEYKASNFSLKTRPDPEKTSAYRPPSSSGFRFPYNLSDPIGNTHYEETFYPKYVPKEEPIRTGTASGTRSNNPHPSNEFMVFRFRPLKMTSNPNSDWSQPIGDELIAQVIKNQMKSTYATDYVNNVDAKAKFAEKEKHTLHATSSARMLQWRKQRETEMNKSIKPFEYNDPFNYESLHISPSRYGSNKRHEKAAFGIVPECSKFWHNFGIPN